MKTPFSNTTMKGLTITLLLLMMVRMAPDVFAQGTERARPARRVALVIGNAGYASAPLPNPANDAKIVAESLGKAGFTVIMQRDLDLAGMRSAIREFADALAEGDTALFYYAGHGAQIDGQNYLIPVDVPLAMKEFEAEDRSVKVHLALAAMEYRRSALNIVILDCCRDNPFSRGWRTVSHGLAEMKAPTETMIAYATAPGKAALDGTGNNSPYSQALAEEILRPGVKIHEVFINVARKVHANTQGEQRPWTSSDLLSEFYFIPGPAETGATNGIATAPPSPALAVADSPPAKDHSLDDIFDGTMYELFNRHSRERILIKVQDKLKQAGLYAGALDGLPGTGTATAIRAWQTRQQLTATGALDADTLKSLSLYDEKEQTPPAPQAVVQSRTKNSSPKTASKPASREGSSGLPVVSGRSALEENYRRGVISEKAYRQKLAEMELFNR